jgi:hypothetical protein
VLVERRRLERGRAEVHGAHDLAEAHLAQAVVDAGADAADIDEDAPRLVLVDHLLEPPGRRRVSSESPSLLSVALRHGRTGSLLPMKMVEVILLRRNQRAIGETMKIAELLEPLRRDDGTGKPPRNENILA